MFLLEGNKGLCLCIGGSLYLFAGGSLDLFACKYLQYCAKVISTQDFYTNMILNLNKFVFVCMFCKRTKKCDKDSC